MIICNCDKIEWFETVFGVAIFAIILFVMQDKTILLFEQMEWYRALAVTLGGITVAGTIGIVSGLSAVWIVHNIGLVVVFATIFFGLRFIMI